MSVNLILMSSKRDAWKPEVKKMYMFLFVALLALFSGCDLPEQGSAKSFGSVPELMDGDPVKVFSGELQLSRKDIALPEHPEFKLTADYSSDNKYHTKMGFGWNSYLFVRRFQAQGDGYSVGLRNHKGQIEYFDGNTNVNRRLTNSDFVALGGDEYSIQYGPEEKWFFDGQGRLVKIDYAIGKSVVFVYESTEASDVTGQSNSTTDGIWITEVARDWQVSKICEEGLTDGSCGENFLELSYNATSGYLEEVKAFEGTNNLRDWVNYTYDQYGNLTSVEMGFGAQLAHDFFYYEYGDNPENHQFSAFSPDASDCSSCSEAADDLTNVWWDEIGRVERQEYDGQVLEFEYEPVLSGAYIKEKNEFGVELEGFVDVRKTEVHVFDASEYNSADDPTILEPGIRRIYTDSAKTYTTEGNYKPRRSSELLEVYTNREMNWKTYTTKKRTLVVYNEANKVIRREESGKAIEKYVFNELGLLDSLYEVFPVGGELVLDDTVYFEAYTHDSQGRLLTKVRGSWDDVSKKTEHRYEYGTNASGNKYQCDTIVVSDTDKAFSCSEYDSQGRMAKRTEISGSVTEYAYSTYADETETLDQKEIRKDGQLISTERRNQRGELVWEKNAQSAVREFEYNASGNKIYEIGFDGYKTNYQWANDLLESKTEGIDPDDSSVPTKTTYYSYDEQNRKVATYYLNSENDRIYVDSVIYDFDGNVIQRFDETHMVEPKFTYEYNELGQMISQTDAEGIRTRFMYDVQGNVIETLKGRKSLSASEFDERGRLKYSYDPVTYSLSKYIRRKTEYKYDHQDRVVEETDALGYKTTYTYDKLGNMLSKNFDGAVWTYEYGNDNLLDKQITPEGVTTIYLYNEIIKDQLDYVVVKAKGNSALAIESGDFVRKNEYENTRLARIYQGTGTDETQYIKVQEYTYDNEGRVKESTDALSRTTIVEYDNFGRQTTTTLPNGVVQETVYDNFGRVLRTIVGGQVQKKIGYKTFQLNRPDTIMIPGEDTLVYTYNNAGQITEQMNRAGMIWQREYDKSGRLYKTIDPEGDTEIFKYDERGNLVEKTDASGNITNYSYDAMGNQIQIQDAAGNRNFTMQSFRSGGKRLNISYPNGDYKLSIYNPSGQLTKTSQKQRDTTRYHYNSFGKPDTVYTTSTANTSWYDSLIYTYDANQRLESVVRKNSEYTHQWSLVWTYDNIGRKTSETQTIGAFTKSVSYEYDDASNSVKITYPNGKVIQKTYSDQQQLEKLEFNDAGTLSLIAEYGLEQIPEKTLTFGNGIIRTDVYLAPGQMESRTYAKSGTYIWSMSFEHFADGKVQSVDRNSAPDESFSYQTDDQLTQAATGTITAGTFSSSSYTSFSYDKLGNRRSVEVNGTTTAYGVSSSSVSSSSSDVSSSSEEAPVANSANQFDFAGENTVSWNDRGDLIQNGNLSYSWDRMGRLTSVTENESSTTLVSYEYDALGRKIKRVSATEITYFIYDGWQVIEEYTQTTEGDPLTLSQYHIYGQYIDELIATVIMNEPTETIHYFHAGLNHNVEAITDASGALVSYYTYDAFGSATEHPTSGTSGNTTLFQGREWDSQAGLYYFRNRWYSPDLGRFISRDPIDFQAGDVNLYRFVGNGPVNGVDPMGLDDNCRYNCGEIPSIRARTRCFEKCGSIVPKNRDGNLLIEDNPIKIGTPCEQIGALKFTQYIQDCYKQEWLCKRSFGGGLSGEKSCRVQLVCMSVIIDQIKGGLNGRWVENTATKRCSECQKK